MDWNGAEFDWDSVTRDWNPAMTDVVTNKRTKWNTPKKYNRTIYLMVFLLVILVGNALFPMSFLRRICPTSPTTVNLASFEEGATVIPSLTNPHPYQRTWYFGQDISLRQSSSNAIRPNAGSFPLVMVLLAFLSLVEE
ncbi:hypothetical protein FRC14_002233 [Serendipita sp. 396]|nr:hypothetical protein FRC14_002233 [Serendipita sp. 396]